MRAKNMKQDSLKDDALGIMNCEHFVKHKSRDLRLKTGAPNINLFMIIIILSNKQQY